VVKVRMLELLPTVLSWPRFLVRRP
jgi:hypothetical protein